MTNKTPYQPSLKTLLYIILATLVFFFPMSSPVGLLADSFGGIRGQVLNLSNQVITGAQVDLFRSKELVSRTSTNSDGIFEFRSVDSAVYSLTVTAQGYVPKSIPDVHVTPDKIERVNVSLEDIERTGPQALPEYVSRGPQWNIWLEDYAKSAQIMPTKKLLMNKTYLLEIDLTGIDLTGNAGIYSAPIGPELSTELSRDTRNTVPIEVLAIPESTFFDPIEPRVKTLAVALDKIKAARNRKFSVSQDLLDYLRQNPDGPLVYGKQEFIVKTRDMVGSTFVALSFWVDGKFPVDEAILPVCIVESQTDSCPSEIRPLIGLNGIDSVRTAVQGGKFAYPDAALHFLETGSRSVIGVFRCNSCPDWSQGKFMAWELGTSTQDLQSYLTGTLLDDFEHAGTREAFVAHGEDLFSTLFQGTTAGLGQTAQEAFVKFINEHWRDTRPTPSIFVRILPQQGDPLFLVPFGLMVPPGHDDFVGFHFRVETPLESQNYDTPEACVSNWSILIPKLDRKNPEDALQEARAPFASEIRRFKSWTGHTTVYDQLDGFRDWLRAKGDQNRTAILIMGHHDKNRIFLTAPEIPIESAAVSRKLKSPSVVFLNACGTGKPDSWNFVRKFNSSGASTAIATSIEVDGRLAGLFASRLVKELRDNEKDPSYTLGQAKFDAAIAVSKMHKPAPNDAVEYGPEPLIYMLAGNGGLRLCAPPPQTPDKTKVPR